MIRQKSKSDSVKRALGITPLIASRHERVVLKVGGARSQRSWMGNKKSSESTKEETGNEKKKAA